MTYYGINGVKSTGFAATELVRRYLVSNEVTRRL